MPTPAKKNSLVELLAPAGNWEKLEIAAHYGADAVYLADRRFSLRNFADNFSLEELAAAAQFTREHGLKMYVACNIFARSGEAAAITEYLRQLGRIQPDALIVADPGVLLLIRETIPHIPVHLSTQANTTSLQAVRFWEQQGIKRLNLARELSLAEIAEIAGQCSAEIEAFVHGAVCISYSGRCLLSSFLSDRHSNRGECSHPCRWQYQLCESRRPGQYYPLAEDARGSYVLNAKDLCMLEHLDKMIATGVTALKIEGRMKSIHYLAATVKTYREAIDTCYAAPGGYTVRRQWRETLAEVSHRGYGTNFYLGPADADAFNYTAEKISPRHIFAGKVLRKKKNRRVLVEIRNKLQDGDRINILGKEGPTRNDTIRALFDEKGDPADCAQPNSRITLQLNEDCQPNDLIRKVE